MRIKGKCAEQTRTGQTQAVCEHEQVVLVYAGKPPHALFFKIFKDNSLESGQLVEPDTWKGIQIGPQAEHTSWEGLIV